MQIEQKESEIIAKEILEDLIKNTFNKTTEFKHTGYVPNPSSFSDSRIDHDDDIFLQEIRKIPLKSQSILIESPDGEISIKRVKHTSFNSTPDDIIINHIKIANQHVYNLCGYHNAHTMVFLTKIFKLGILRCSDFVQKQAIQLLLKETSDRLNSSASFWQFHINLTNFLFMYAKKSGKDINCYPWKKYNCLYGDYERVYHQVFMKHLPLYKEIFASHSKEFKIYHCKLQLQFGKYVTDFHEQKDIQDKIDEFRSQSLPKRKLFLLKIAVTNHWVGFAISKIGEKIIFLYFDSRDEDNIGWTKEQIAEFIEKEHQRRIDINHERIWNDFHKLCHLKSREDIQTIAKLIPMAFMGKVSLFDHNFKNHFIPTYESNWRRNLLFPLTKMRGELEIGSDILGFLFENFGELKSFVREFAYFFHLLDYLQENNLKVLFVIYLECRGVLDRCLKYLKKVKYGKSQEVFSNWKYLKKVAETKKWKGKMKNWGLMYGLT